MEKRRWRSSRTFLLANLNQRLEARRLRGFAEATTGSYYVAQTPQTRRYAHPLFAIFSGVLFRAMILLSDRLPFRRATLLPIRRASLGFVSSSSEFLLR